MTPVLPVAAAPLALPLRPAGAQRPQPAHWPQARRRLSMALAAVLVVTATPPAAAWEMPSLDPVLRYQPKLPLTVLTADGVEIAQFGAERRIFVPIQKMPKLLQDAVLAVEDVRFREHSGIDPRGVARAVLSMVTGGKRQGASTITQQVARTFFLSNRRTAERKVKEALIALEMERQMSKDKILELYLNEIFLGQRAYGFAAAAQVYFGKPLDKLDIAETAMLAGLPQNPHYANPVTHFERAQQRQRIVLLRMKETGVINEAQYQAARAQTLQIRSPLSVPLHAEHVAEMARRVVVERFGTEAYSQGLRITTSLRATDQAAAHAAVRKGILAFERKRAWRGPEAIETLDSTKTDAELEAAVADALRDHLDDEELRVAMVLSSNPEEVVVQLASGERVRVTGAGLAWAQAFLGPKKAAPKPAPKPAAKGKPAAAAAEAKPAKADYPLASAKLPRGAVVRVVRQADGQWAIGQWPQLEAGLVGLDPRSGRIRALVGGFDFNHQAFNHVTQAQRQPGSSFKPFLYSAALERGVMPATLVDDTPIAVGNWTPQNSDGRYDGPIHVKDALARSKNMVSIRLLRATGVAPVRDWAGRFGIDAARQPANATLALGAGSVSPLQLAQGYAVFANGGYRVSPVLVERITDANGRTLFEAPAAPALDESQRAIPARNAWLMNTLLNEVTRSGTAARAQRELGRSDLYGKTGTTNDAVDAWFAGYHPSVVSVVWMGMDDPKSLGERESGGGLALPVWIDYMRSALKGAPPAPLAPAPGGLVQAQGQWFYDDQLATGAWIARIDSQDLAQRGDELGPEGVAALLATPSGAPGAASSNGASGASGSNGGPAGEWSSTGSAAGATRPAAGSVSTTGAAAGGTGTSTTTTTSTMPRPIPPAPQSPPAQPARPDDTVQQPRAPVFRGGSAAPAPGR